MGSLGARAGGSGARNGELGIRSGGILRKRRGIHDRSRATESRSRAIRKRNGATEDRDRATEDRDRATEDRSRATEDRSREIEHESRELEARGTARGCRVPPLAGELPHRAAPRVGPTFRRGVSLGAPASSPALTVHRYPAGETPALPGTPTRSSSHSKSRARWVLAPMGVSPWYAPSSVFGCGGAA